MGSSIARDYDSRVGAWTAKDPLRFPLGGTNRFGYCAADPVNQVDPTGAIVDATCRKQIQIGCESGCESTCGGALDAACVSACVWGTSMIEALAPGSICNNEPPANHPWCNGVAMEAYDDCRSHGYDLDYCLIVQSIAYSQCVKAGSN